MIRVEPSPPLRQTLRVDIVEFLTARLDEDEQIARDVENPSWSVGPFVNLAEYGAQGKMQLDGLTWPSKYIEDERMYVAADADHIARHDPARVLADVAAKRAIVQRLHHSVSSGIRGDAERYVECACGWERPLSDRERYDDLDFYQRHLDTLGVTETVSAGILRFLAQPYAGHADFDPAWKVGE